MSKTDRFYTVYELFYANDDIFPFWIKHWNNPETCLCVIGWSKYIKAQSRGGTAALKVAAEIRHSVEMPSKKDHDFFETGTFVGLRYYLDKKTLIHGNENKPLVVAGASTRSWLPA